MQVGSGSEIYHFYESKTQGTNCLPVCYYILLRNTYWKRSWSIREPFKYRKRFQIRCCHVGLDSSFVRKKILKFLSYPDISCFRELLKHHYHTYGLIMGGANRNSEAQKLAKGRENLIFCQIQILVFIAQFKVSKGH